MECCLELLDRDLLVSLQDLGAAGLTSSASEMASAGGVGIDIDVARVPLRNPDLEPFEVMVSESQERMLAVVEPEKLEQVLAVCRRWETGGTAIGEVTAGDAIRILDGGEVVGEMPVSRCSSTTARSTTSSRRCRASGSTGTARELERRPIRPRSLARAALLADDRLEALGLRAVRLDRAVAHRAPARVGGRRGPGAGRDRRSDRGLDRRQRPPGRVRSLQGDGRGGARVRAEPRLRRRRAARADQLPQLRQPGEADTSPGSSTARPRRWPMPARRSGVPVVGGNVSLYNETDARTDLPDAGRRDGRRAALGRGAAGRGAPGGRRDRAGRPVRSLARGLGAGEAARGARPRPGARPATWPRRSARRGAARRASRGPRRQRRRLARARRVRDRRRRRRSAVELAGSAAQRGECGDAPGGDRGLAGATSAPALGAARLAGSSGEDALDVSPATRRPGGWPSLSAERRALAASSAGCARARGRRGSSRSAARAPAGTMRSR